MRFLFVAAFPPAADSGAAGTLLAIGRALQDLGHPVDFEWEPPEPARIRHATASRLLELPRRQLRQVGRRLERTAYDVVIVSQPFAYLVYERLMRRYPRTLFLNRTHGWEARLYQAQRRLAFGEARGTGARVLGGVSATLTRWACARTARAAHGVIAPASLCAQYIRARYGLPPAQVPVIGYGMDPAAARPASPSDPRDPRRRMLFVGNYLRRKGSHLLETSLPPLAQEFPDASLTVVADGSAKPRVEASFRPAYARRLEVRPWIPRDQLHAVYAAHDILLFPSLFEGFGKVWMEAMAAGMCVVGFAEGGLPDVAREGEALLCPPGDVGAFGRLLRRALADPRGAAEMGQRAQSRVGGFSWERTARETVEACRRLGAR